MVLNNLPVFERVKVSGNSLSGSFGELNGYRVVGALIDGAATAITVKVKAKKGEDGEAAYIGFRYKKLDEKEYSLADKDGITIAANGDAIIGVVTADSLAMGEYDRISLELETEAGGEIGTFYSFFAQPRYTE
jgi:hypothetical protein